MGSCFSQKKDCSSPSSVAVSTVKPEPVDANKSQKGEQVIPQQETTKKEKGEERLVRKEIFVIKHRNSHEKRPLPHQNEGVDEEEEIGNNNNNVVDAILIQCERLSRSNSSSARKYSGSRRSYDFDHTETSDGVVEKKSSEDEDQVRQHRQSHRHRSSSQGRRRTPSRDRERDQQHQQHQRSSGKRVSRSPGRRNENDSSNTTSTAKPGKVVAVPATVNVVERSNNNVHGRGAVEPIKRISVRRNVGSPRSQSPARAGNPTVNVSNDSQQHPSLTRTSSRKAENSPYKRNPLIDIDSNNNRLQILSQAPMKPNVEIAAQVTNYKASGTDNEEPKALAPTTNNFTLPQTLTKSRYSRRSRDLDLNPETLLNPTPSYTALLLEDIQNFHQNNGTPFSLPPCVAKACSILEAVADLGSTTSSSLSCAFSENPSNLSFVGKKLTEGKDSFAESEVLARDNLTEPSFHKFLSVRRGGTLGRVDLDEQESSGSNSYVGGGVKHNWNFSSSLWEPNSADSTGCWTSMEDNLSSETRKGFSGKKTDTNFQKGGIWRNRAAASRSLHTVSIVSAAASS